MSERIGGNILSSRGAYDAARQRFEEALAVFQDLGDRQSEATCLRTIGAVYWRQEANDAAHRAFAESLDICRTIGDQLGEASCLDDSGLVYIAQGDYDETRRCWEESVALYRSLGLEKRAAIGLHRLGILHSSRGDYAAAQRCLEESLAINRSVGAKSSEALDLGWLGRLHLQRGEYDEARRHLEAALALDREIGGSEEQVWHLVWMGAVAYEAGNLTEAKARVQEAVWLARKRGVNLGTYQVCWLVAVHLAHADGKAALAAARQALADAESKRRPAEAGACCTMLGAVHSSGLLAEAEDPVPYFERALALLGDKDPFGRGVALRCYGAYLVHSGDPSTGRRGEPAEPSGRRRERGQAHLRKAQAIFERIGAQGELAKVTRLLAGEDTLHLRW